MAALNLSVPSGEVSLTASTAKTVITARAPAQQMLRILGVEIFGKGISNTDTPIKIEVSRITTDGGTASTITPSPNDDDYTATPQGTYKGNYTSEPVTYGANLRIWEVHPQTSLIYMFPMGQEIILKNNNEIGFRATSGQTETISINLIIEE